MEEVAVTTILYNPDAFSSQPKNEKLTRSQYCVRRCYKAERLFHAFSDTQLETVSELGMML